MTPALGFGLLSMFVGAWMLGRVLTQVVLNRAIAAHARRCDRSWMGCASLLHRT